MQDRPPMFPTDPDPATPTPRPGPSVDAEPALVDEPAADEPAELAEPGARGRGSRPIILGLALVLVGLIAGSALFLSGFALGSLRATTPGTPLDEQATFQPFWDTYRAITEDYAGGPVDRKTIIEGAIRGMISALGDPFSAYLSPDEYRRSLEGLSGSFGGIGATIQVRRVTGQGACANLGSGCVLSIVQPIQGAPAEKAGLLAGDVIERVDGTPLDGLTSDQALARIRGPKGTSVTLTVLRGTAAPFELTIVRDVIVQKQVETRTLAGGAVGYIRLADFSDQAAADLGAAVAADVAAGQQELVIDLRGNGGGYVTDAQRVISQFIPAGTTIFWQEDAAHLQVPTVALAGGSATDPKIRVAVLIDGGSASASEIVAGALQDLGRAKLVGSKSYGKGTIQIWQQLGENNGGFRLTVARWLTPNKRWIHQIGLQPDVPVVVPPNLAPGSDPVLDKALEVLATVAAGAPVLERAA
jgi:carboxyl-terminal processing protease